MIDVNVIWCCPAMACFCSASEMRCEEAAVAALPPLKL